jgi:hypothetical protein
MRLHVESALRASGYLARVADLSINGVTPGDVARAVKAGELFRVTRGWVATPTASQTAVLAVVHRGKLTGPTALASCGIWDGGDRRIHVQVARHSVGRPKVLATPIARYRAPNFAPTGLVRHWTNELHPVWTDPSWRVSVVDALSVTARAVPRDQFIACVDSALHNRQLDQRAVTALSLALPDRLRGALRTVDARAESGLESLARVRLAPLARSVELQVPMPGIGHGGRDGRVDILLNGWLAIELDGDEFHTLAQNRLRDAAIVQLGRRVHHFGYHQVVNDWTSVEATVTELLRYPPAGTN